MIVDDLNKVCGDLRALKLIEEGFYFRNKYADGEPVGTYQEALSNFLMGVLDTDADVLERVVRELDKKNAAQQ